MYGDLRVRSLPPRSRRRRPSYRLQPRSFAFSAGLHGIVVALLFLVPSSNERAGKTAYQELIQPQAHKLIWYDFHKKLPDVSASKRVGNSPDARGAELSKQAIIAASPNPISKQQFIWRPAPKLLIPQDLPLPNLIARTNTSLPPPPPTEVKQKLERPATKGERSPNENNSPPSPKGDVNHAPSPNEASQASKPKRAFVPPVLQAHAKVASMLDTPLPDPSLVGSLKTDNGVHALQLKKALILPPEQGQGPRAALPAAVLDAPDAAVGGSGGSKMQSALPEGLGTPSLSQGVAPPPNGPIGQTASTGNGAVDIAIVSLHPGDRLGELPDGARPGRFSKAPALGDASSGEGGGSGGVTVPDLSVREARTRATATPDFLSGNRKTVLYAETVRGVSVSTLSVPLRPSSRTIPGAIDARFQGRSVFTMVIPIENFPDYGGDWILWFADRNQRPGDTSEVRAPIPFRKHEQVDSMLANRTERRLQIVAVIKKDGRLEEISLLRHSSAAVEQAVIQDLQSWEFKPATRAGTAVDVDVVFEIPFNLTAEAASKGAR